MDATPTQQQFNSLFPQDMSVDQIQRDLEPQRASNAVFPFNGALSSTGSLLNTNQITPPFALDLLGNLQAVDKSSSQTAQFTPQMLLEQQFKLNQLQQLQHLQNQIFQQQIALISRLPEPSSLPEGQRDQGVRYHGLPTPGSSTELRAQPSADYVSPMTLHYIDVAQSDAFSNDAMNNITPQPSQNEFYQPRGSTSAPAQIAFHTSPPFPLQSPNAELDFDISPLTSPWLGAHQQNVPHQVPGKRTASPSGGDDATTGTSRRKKAPPAGRSANASAASLKKPSRGSKSTSATPLMRCVRPRRSTIAGERMGDTPSPVDLSMPPPAPPAAQHPPSLVQRSISSPQTSIQLTPVTPASIMNLGPLGLDSSLAPPVQQTPKSTAKPLSKSKATSESSGKVNSSKQAQTGTMFSPGLKPILPAASTSPAQLGSLGTMQQPMRHVRKTSHKAAEQKRRDSLKTTFDDLRVLLPPIPLPSDENYPDEPILPGALPPRGPPKSGGDGPNKGVSKLQLLRCGNDFIRQLKGRVERRDEEIERLRREVRRLRILVTPDAVEAVGEPLDLERDLDADEPSRASVTLVEDEMDDEGDD